MVDTSSPNEHAQLYILFDEELSEVAEHVSAQCKNHWQPQITANPDHILRASPENLIIFLQTNTTVDKATLFDSSRCFVIGTLADCDISIPSLALLNEPATLTQLVKVAHDNLNATKALRNTQRRLNKVLKHRQLLSDIGAALSSERNLDRLLSMVLTEGMNLANCEAASLYLIDHDEPKQLIFKLALNRTTAINYQERRFDLNEQSLAGFVAINDEILNIADAYQIDAALPYQFDKRFDDETGFRTKELLVIPMNNHKKKTIGVLQFINALNHTGFDEECTALLLSLASQAAIAIDNSQLIENIELLFEGFVSASVKAIEARDPVTSGHSFRVATLTTELAKVVDEVSIGTYKYVQINHEQMKEIRYASLLHDFGKVGVKEDVLLKSNKLHDHRHRELQLKIDWQRQTLQKNFFYTMLKGGKHDDWESTEEYVKLTAAIKRLDHYEQVIRQANMPTILESEVKQDLEEILNYSMDNEYPFESQLLSNNDFLSLSVSRGSLTMEERDEIQSHVVHTQSFLSEIPWTDELCSVPCIAGAHHEKLDGTGYPHGLNEKDIPLASQMMTITDIYDALTARDRPYKKAMNPEIAMNIIKDEATKGKVNNELVDMFVEHRIYRFIEGM